MPAWNRTEIPKEKLENLYLNQKLSIAKIAEQLNCSTSPVHKTLREYKIPIRSLSEACIKIPITKKQLETWYFKNKLSMNEIAKRLGCTPSAIVYKFQKFEIKSRGNLGLRKPLKITKKGLIYHYNRKLSLAKIARIFHCSEGGLERKFKKFGLKSRGNSNRACKYKKFDFSEDPIEKAYLIGFRLGDLNVYNLTNIIQARCSSTINCQIQLIKKLFSPYTTAHVRKEKRGTIEIVCLLNKTFSFLVPKEDKIPEWILENKFFFFSFFAGYTDAEGSFYFLKPGKHGKTPIASYGIQTQDKQIIYKLWKNLQKHEITTPPPIISRKAGRISPDGKRNNKDMWRIGVCRKKSLWNLIHLLKPYLKHKNKVKRIKEVKQNLILRNKIPYCQPIDLSIPKLS